MKTVFSFIALALVVLVVVVYLKESGQPVMGMLTALCGGILLLLRIVPYLAELFSSFREISSSLTLKTDHLGVVIKALCLAYIGEFAAELCVDAGESGLGKKVSLGTKVIILVMAVPLLETILTTVTGVFH